MSTDLTLHGRVIGTVFDLLGNKENDITYSVGWALSESEAFARLLLAHVLPATPVDSLDMVQLQEGLSGAGFTDIEVKANEGKLHLVIEAKRGYNLPDPSQLEKYAIRTKPQPTALLVLAEASGEFVQERLPQLVAGTPVHYRSWRDIEQLARAAANESRSHAEKRLLRDLSLYLRGLMTMQNVSSNLVYVVSLGGEIEDTGISFREVVTKYDTYFCPIGGARGGWPKEPPNYLGFRFDGKLQQVRHVERYRVAQNSYAGFEPLKGKVDWSHERHWVFELGPAIIPPKEVSTGKLWPTHRGWIAIDLLLTCETVAEARDKTQARLEQAGQDS